jgi:hypothetical protein
MPVTLIPVEFIVVAEPTVIIPTVTCEPEFSGGCASIDMVEADPEVAIAVIANPTKLSVLTLTSYKTTFFVNSKTRKVLWKINIISNNFNHLTTKTSII